MADDKISESGIWLTDDGKVVHKQPEGGATQLVRPGGRITTAAQARMDSLKADPAAKPLTAAEALGNPVNEEPAKPVRSEPAKRATKSSK